MEFKVITNLMANLEEENLMLAIDEFLALNPSREEGLYVIEACRQGTEKVGTLLRLGSTLPVIYYWQVSFSEK